MNKPVRAQKFIVDGMLGGVARKLRLLGFDVIFLGGADDSELLKLALEDARILITRDRELYTKAKKRGIYTVYAAGDEMETIVAVLRELGVKSISIEPERARCTYCNTPIARVRREDVKDLVPPKVYDRFTEFYLCKTCKRVYWKGNQWKNIKLIEARLNALIGG